MIKLILTFAFMLNAAAFASYYTKEVNLVECERQDYAAQKIVLKYVEKYNNVEGVTASGITINRIRLNDYEQVAVFNKSSHAFYGFSGESAGPNRLHFRSVSLDEVDLTDEDLLSSIRPNLANLSNLRPYGLALVDEFILDKNSGQARIRSLQAIGHSASVYDDLHHYRAENCKVVGKIPQSMLSSSASFDPL